MNSHNINTEGDKAPESTVCIGLMVYNDEKFLERALKSILNQSFKDFILILSDDGSTDSSPDIMRKYAEQDARIILNFNSTRSGMIAHYHKIFSLRPLNSKYFAWAAGHDLYAPNWLESLLNRLKTKNDIALVYCNTEYIDSEDVVKTKKRDHFQGYDNTEEELSSGAVSITKASGFGRMIYGLFSCDAISNSGGMPRLLYPDVMLIIKISLYGKIGYVDDALYQRRQMKSNLSLRDINKRQRHNLFINKSPHNYLPSCIVNSVHLLFSKLENLPTEIEKDLLSLRIKIAINYFIRDFTGQIKGVIKELRPLYKKAHKKYRKQKKNTQKTIKKSLKQAKPKKNK